MIDSPHIPVLYNEVIDLLKDIDSGYGVDCTTGFGGHSELILKNLQNINLICFDRDIDALSFSKDRLHNYLPRVQFFHTSFSDGTKELQEKDLKFILADIGVSSYQLDNQNRGFGFEGDSLDMRMDRSKDFSAYNIINEYSEDELSTIIKNYGEDKFHKKIASIIVKQRDKSPINSSKELAKLIENNFSRGKIHPATKLFQAIRIEVNDELGELEKLLENIEKLKTKDLMVVIISFHSLEDRIVKQRFKEWGRSCLCDSLAMRCECGNDNHLGFIITKKPIMASSVELKTNPRSRSAKMRAFKFR